MDLSEAGPHGIVRLTGQQDNVLPGHLAADAVVVIEDIPVPVRIQELKFLLRGPNARLLEQLPGNGLAAGLPRLDGSSGILPGTGETLSLSVLVLAIQ